jgi:[protein-PII] uridylyltransferase
VQNHLVMSTTAQRKDLSDPQVIHDFAQHRRRRDPPDYLYVLTVADINATNPSLWNSWRASLLRQLYTETKRALRRGLENPVDREEQIRRPKARPWTSWCAAAPIRTTSSSSGRNWAMTISCATPPATWPGTPTRSSSSRPMAARWC